MLPIVEALVERIVFIKKSFINLLSPRAIGISKIDVEISALLVGVRGHHVDVAIFAESIGGCSRVVALEKNEREVVYQFGMHLDIACVSGIVINIQVKV